MPRPVLSARHRLLAAAPALAAAVAVGVAGCGGSSASTRSAVGSGSAGNSSQRGGSPASAGPRSSPPGSGPTALRYRPLTSLASALQDPAAAALGGGRYALLGGLNAADTSTDAVLVGSLAAVRRAATLPNAQHDAQAARLGSKVYVFGGGQFSQYDHILAFDPSNDTVASVGTLPRAESDVAVAGNGVTAYVVGGFDGARSLASIVAWAPGHQPRVVAELPLALRYAAAALTDGQLIVAGGSTPDGQASDGIYGFDVASGRVRRLGRLPQPLTHSAAAVLGGSVYLVGGRGAGDGSQTAAVLRVDPATGAVRRAATLPLPLSDAGVVAIGGAIVVAGGRTPAGTQAAVGELVPSR